MLNDLIAHIAKINGLADPIAKQALGIVLNAADRQSSPFAKTMFKTLPGARDLAARMGEQIEAPVGDIARLIERTPGGRSHVARSMLAELHCLGLDHAQIGALPNTIAAFMKEAHGLKSFAHLGDMFGAGEEAQAEKAEAA